MRRVVILLTAGAMLLALSAGVAVAGTGIGGMFNLGKVNAVNKLSVLKGNAKGAMLRVVNGGPGAALQLVVKPGKPPMTVNSGVKVKNLNSDTLDGKDSSAFLGANQKAVDSAHADEAGHATNADSATNAGNADNLDGLDQNAFLRSNGKAVDANNLDGKDSSEFLGSNGKAADSDLLDGKNSSDFLASGGKATDADKLDGQDSTAFLASKTYFLSQPFTVAMASSATGTAECDAGDVLLSGGYVGAEVTTFINSSAPSQTSSGPQRSYSVSATNDGLANDEITINITCADLNPDNPIR